MWQKNNPIQKTMWIFFKHPKNYMKDRLLRRGRGEINSTKNNSLEYKKPHQNRLTFFGTELKQSQQ